MGLRKELLALAFGALLVLVTFGDNHLGNIAGVPIGNLDTIFGLALWPVLDVLYPLATIAVFILHGWNRDSKLKLKSTPTLVFAVFIILLALMNLDDFVLALNHLGSEFECLLASTILDHYFLAIPNLFRCSIFPLLLNVKLHKFVERYNRV